MGMINCLWSGVSIILILLVGYFLFNEKLNNRDITGIILIIIGIILINWDGEHKEYFEL